MPSERGHRRVGASKGLHPLDTGTVKQNTRPMGQSPAPDVGLSYKFSRFSLETYPAHEGLFTYHRSSGPVFWCIHGLRHTKYHTLGAERERDGRVEIREGRTNEKLGRGQRFSRGLWRSPRKATKKLFWKEQGATLHLWFRQSSQLSCFLPTVDFRLPWRTGGLTTTDPAPKRTPPRQR